MNALEIRFNHLPASLGGIIAVGLTLFCWLTPAADAAESAKNKPHLRLMTYNVWNQWSRINDGWRKGVESVKRSAPDVIGLQEADPAFAERLAETLGWHAAPGITGSPQIISRHPVVESRMAGIAGAARIRIAGTPPRDVWVFNCHLDPGHYGPYAAGKSGATVASVLEEEARSRRLGQIQAILEGMADVIAAAADTPVFLVGDFNVPSHLDWTEATAPTHHGVGPVRWPTSVAVETAGFTDSYRAVHPDPLADPAATWTPLFKGGEPQDRIDRVYHLGRGVAAVAAAVFTTDVEHVVDAPYRGNTSRLGAAADNTWPSDHAAVVVDFEFAHPAD